MIINKLRAVFLTALVTVGSIGATQAQSVSVNNISCPGATVTLGAGTIAINTAGCGGTAPVLTAPAFTSGAPTGTGNVGAPYSFNFAATGNPVPTFALVTAGTQPTGLTLSSNGVLSGTPTTPGTYTFAVQATNSQGSALSPSTGTHSVVISNLPAVTSALPANATTGVAYSHTFVASQTIPAGGWTVSTGTLPAWVTLNPNTGVLSGTPAVTDVGTTNFTVSATNANGTAQQAVMLSVITLTAPTITTFSPPAGMQSSAYTYTFVATGSAPINWTLNSGMLPPGLNLATTGILSGTPTAAGTFLFTVKAANAMLPDAISSQISLIINPSAAPGAITHDINNNLIPTPVSKNPKVAGAVHPAPSGGGNYPGGEVRAWSVNPASCANTTPAITTLWYHNINFFDYGGQNSIENVEFLPNQAIVYGFTAPSIGSFTAYTGLIEIQTGTTGTPAPTFVTISKTPCDFDATKISTVTPCYSTAGAENGFGFRITAAPTTACQLIPGDKYYLNLRFQDARPSPVGTPTQDACTMQNASSCGAIMRISITGAY